MSVSAEVRFWVSRVLLSLVASLAVAGTAYVCAFLKYRTMATPTESTESTRADLEILRQAVEAHKAATGRFPKYLTDLAVVREHKVRTKEEFPVDQWGHGIRYEVQDGTFRIYSNGKLDKPGGIGDYATLVAGEPDPVAGPPPTFPQFLTKLETIPIQIACILGGLAAFTLCMSQAAGKGGTRPTLGQTIVINIVTALVATFAALMIAGLHLIPGGH
jgi:hypothetical protein